MGTRNLTMVVHENAIKIAQYGQWDGYPEGQGATALEFLNTPGNIDMIKAKLPNVKWLDEEEYDQFLKDIGATGGWVTQKQSNLIREKYPYINRDHGALILELVAESEGEVEIADSREFAKDSLFCEWAYVIDLDKEIFEVYRGFNQSPNTGERFDGPANDRGYYPVRAMAAWSFDELPSKKEFISYFKDNEEEE